MEIQGDEVKFPGSHRVSVAEGSFSTCSLVHSGFWAWSEHKHEAIVGQEVRSPSTVQCQFVGGVEQGENQKENYYYIKSIYGKENE